MKTIIILIVLQTILSVSCASQQNRFTQKDSYQLYEKQKAFNQNYANGAQWARRKALEGRVMNDLVMADTLWAIERIEEVGGRVVSAFFWNETRKLVIRYSEIPTFTHSRLSYAEFADSLKTITEKFYKNRIDSKVNTFGAPLVFISRITKDRIETYYFYD